MHQDAPRLPMPVCQGLSVEFRLFKDPDIIVSINHP